MNRARRGFGLLIAASVGALVGAVSVLGLEGWSRETGPRVRDRPPAAPHLAERPNRVAPRTSILLAWAPGGLPAGAEAVVERTPGVRSATTVTTDLDWAERVRGEDGTVLDAPAAGYRIPLDVALVEPSEYARFVPPSERPAILGLKPGEAVIARTEAALRGGGPGLSIDVGSRVWAVEAEVSDSAANGYEVVGTGPVPEDWVSPYRYVLARVERRARPAVIERRLKRLLAPGQRLRIRAQGETPFLRYGDAVLPQLLLKRTFGEFAARPLPSGGLEIEPGWRSRNIRPARVPILGRVVCHRALIPQLRDALNAVDEAELAYTIDAGDFGGCYSPRFISSNVNGRLSHHSWGIAFDLNVSDNAFGTAADQDHRLVTIMEEHGLTWGGRWLIPDGMHFEWIRFP